MGESGGRKRRRASDETSFQLKTLKKISQHKSSLSERINAELYNILEEKQTLIILIFGI